MRGSFFGFRIATSGMHTARANLNVVAHNAANMEIPGFSRQGTLQSAQPAISMRNGRGMFGTGSAVNNVIRMRDQFIDRRFWSQQGVLGEFNVKVPQLSLIEAILNELPDQSTVGVLGAFNDFFSRLQELSAEAHDPMFRLNVGRLGESLTELLRNNAVALQNQQRDLNGEVHAVVTEINSLGRQVSILNEQIRNSEFNGSWANDLRDKRDLLVDRLSQLVNVTVEERDFSHTSGIENDRRFFISINGHDFVNHNLVHSLELVPRTPDQRRNEMDVDGLFDIRFANGSPFNIFSPNLTGVLKGLIDVRDGHGGVPTKQRIHFETLFNRAVDEGADPADPTTWPNWFVNVVNRMPETFDILNPDGDRAAGTLPWPSFVNVHPWELTAAEGTFNFADVAAAALADNANFDVADITTWPDWFTSAIGRNVGFDTTNPRLWPSEVWPAGPPPFDINNRATWDAHGFEITDESTWNIADFSSLMPDFLQLTPAEADVAPGITITPLPTSRQNVQTTNFKGIPFYMNRLNDLVRTFVLAMNEGLDRSGSPIDGSQGHRNGYSLDGSTGLGFFVWTDANGNVHGNTSMGDFNHLNVLNWEMNRILLEEPDRLQLSSSPNVGESDNAIVEGFIFLDNYQSLFREGSLRDFIVATTTHLSIDLQQANRFQNNFMEMTRVTTNQRVAVSGVDMNEELLDMARFQNLFNVNARMISTMNNIYDTLINRLGMG
ncbi:MAG: hypothetical protein FWG65_04385 [Turicibacter sp.]|nr:hypothetical protein [Turicibacter sp.]